MRLVTAILGKDQITNSAIIGAVKALYDQGMSQTDICSLALDFVGVISRTEVASTLFKKFYGTASTDAEVQPLADVINNGSFITVSLASASADLTAPLGIVDLNALPHSGIIYT